MPPICYNERVKKVYARRFAIFSFSLGSFKQCPLFIRTWSYFMLRDVCRKSISIFLLRWNNLHIALMNNTPPNSFSVDFIHFKYFFCSAFKHRTDWYLVSCFICLIFYFQLINWLPLFPCRAATQQWLIISNYCIMHLRFKKINDDQAFN